MRGRFASGILRRIGEADLVAASDREYVDLAVQLGRDAALRQSVRHRIEQSRGVLFDDVAPMRALEEFLTKAVTK
jgi:predicted O-linked N-acetylglucosamine transferase (SPINDLY family)